MFISFIYVTSLFYNIVLLLDLDLWTLANDETGWSYTWCVVIILQFLRNLNGLWFLLFIIMAGEMRKNFNIKLRS